MLVQPVRTRLCLPPQDDLTDIYRSLIPSLEEGDIVAVSSKIVAIEEGRCVPVGQVENKDDLIRAHSHRYLSRDEVPGGWLMHTLTNGMLIPSAGIDESNADGHYILWPEDPDASAKRICAFLRQESGLARLGVVLTDSHSTPLRRGVVGMGIGYWGFAPLTDYRAKTDLFGRVIHVSQANLVDGIGGAAVLAMGEGEEQTPIALVRGLSGISFLDSDFTTEEEFSSFIVAPEEDLYAPFVQNVPWQKGGRS